MEISFSAILLALCLFNVAAAVFCERVKDGVGDHWLATQVIPMFLGMFGFVGNPSPSNLPALMFLLLGTTMALVGIALIITQPGPWRLNQPLFPGMKR